MRCERIIARLKPNDPGNLTAAQAISDQGLVERLPSGMEGTMRELKFEGEQMVLVLREALANRVV